MTTKIDITMPFEVDDEGIDLMPRKLQLGIDLPD